MKRILLSIVFVFFASIVCWSQTAGEKVLRLSDAPERNIKNSTSDSISYLQALRQWQTIEDINKWIGANFYYDMARAVALGSKRNDDSEVAIHTPEEMYNLKSGVCVDISRFAFETAKAINTNLKLQYLMIDFEPIEIQGSVIRKHWMVSYEKDGQLYMMADSKRPGTISGPYSSIEDFIREYESFRGRDIVSFKLLDDYKKTKRKKLVRNESKKDNRTRILNG